ncbi:hypothetical protein ACQUEF_01610 [Vagococcus fluvialis]|uniref:hypothetical protein n=1 Tax=Vagococcus fluvialis TaxID=2738 RepID=UPI003D09DD70
MVVNHNEMRKKVDAFIDQVSSRRVTHFYLETIAAYTHLDISQFADYIFQLVEWGEVILKFELKCPDYDCPEKFIFDDYDKIPFDNFIEDNRGHEILVSPNYVVTRFEVPKALRRIGVQYEKKLVTFSPLRR